MRTRSLAILTTLVLSLLVLPTRTFGGRGGGRDYVPTDAERARWTLSDMRSLELAFHAYHVDRGRYPEGAGIEQAVAAVLPSYVRSISIHDAWGTPFEYVVSADGASYTLASAGAGGEFDRATWKEEGEFEDFGEDSVVTDGEVTRRWQLHAARDLARGR